MWLSAAAAAAAAVEPVEQADAAAGEETSRSSDTVFTRSELGEVNEEQGDALGNNEKGSKGESSWWSCVVSVCESEGGGELINR